MKIKILILLLIYCLILISCSKKYEKINYYETGEIKEKIVFETKEEYSDKSNYDAFLYYKNGNLKISSKIRNNKRVGQYTTYYPNGNLNSIINFNDGKEHGINRYYDENGRIVKENFYLKGIHMNQMKSYNMKDEKINFYYYVENDTLQESGQLVFDNDDNIIPDKSFHYNVISENDTVNLGELYKFKVEVYTFDQQSKITEFHLGEFDELYNFLDSQNIITDKSSNNKIEFEYQSKQKGYNLIMGKIYVDKNHIQDDGTELQLSREFIFYDDFYVL